jgi:hypothetical protein
VEGCGHSMGRLTAREATEVNRPVVRYGRSVTGRLPGSQRVQLFLCPLKFPRGEAADVDVKLVEARVVAVTSELNLEFQLVALHGKATDAAGGTNTGTAPGAVRFPGRDFPGAECFSSLFTFAGFVGQGSTPRSAEDAACHTPEGQDARCINQRPGGKAFSSVLPFFEPHSGFWSCPVLRLFRRAYKRVALAGPDGYGPRRP